MKIQNYQIVKKSILKFTLCFASFLLFLNCSGNDDNDDIQETSCFTGSYIQEVPVELNDFFEATALYGQEPSADNCIKFRNALSNYINALDKIKPCVPATSLNDFNEALEEAKQQLSETDDCDF